MRRRQFLQRSAALAGAGLLDPGALRGIAGAEPAQPGDGPYGPLRPDADANGVRTPEGFVTRVVATAGAPAGPGGHVWHRDPDGGATFPTTDGGWVYASNSESSPDGGVGALRFDASGALVDAYPLLTGTVRNCAGGATPWDTWLSCEETSTGRVWECNPFAASQGEPRPALGRFAHEAATVDPTDGIVYLTEDNPAGLLYRFVPDTGTSLAAGVLQAARLDTEGLVDWLDVPDPSARSTATRNQVPEATRFNGGEGMWIDDRWIYFATKGDGRIWAFDLDRRHIFPLYRSTEHSPPPLAGVDNVMVSSSGDVFVAEDGGSLRISVITADTLEVAPVLQLTGPAHGGSELTGPALSPDGSRLLFSSQRGGPGRGITFEMRGPFRTGRVGHAGATAVGIPEPVPNGTVPADTTTMPPVTSTTGTVDATDGSTTSTTTSTTAAPLPARSSASGAAGSRRTVAAAPPGDGGQGPSALASGWASSLGVSVVGVALALVARRAVVASSDDPERADR